MMLTTEQMQQILVEELTGSDKHIFGVESDKFRESVRLDIEEAEENGWVIEIPPEWEVNVGDDEGWD